MSIKKRPREPCHHGGKQTTQGEEAKTKHTQRHRPHRRSEERSQEAAEDRGRGTHPHQKGYKCALAEFKEGATDHTMMNTSVSGAHSTPTTRETWCRGKDPHTGPEAFNAMRHNEEEKSMHSNHSKHRGKATRPSPGATIPRGRDQ